MTKYCDLHTHTYYSDGAHSPEYLIKECAKQNISYLSITDHDCVSAYSEKEIYKIAQKNKVTLIPGVEINCIGSEILGYFIDLKYEPLKKIIEENSAGSTDVSIQKVYWLIDNGYNITLEDVYKHTGPDKKVMGLHIALELVRKGYCFSLQDAFVNIIKKIKVKYHPKRLKTKKAISEIINSGGVAILPHPWYLPTNIKEDIESYFYKLKEQGLVGFESTGPFLDSEIKFVNETKKIAKRLDLIETGGSDFHGLSLFPENRIGDFKIDYKVLKKLEFRKN